jgi:hypothetical protein
MKKIASALVVGLLVAAIAPATALAGSGGDTPTAGSGTWDDCNIVRTFDEAGPNIIVTVTILQNYYGMLDGRYVGIERDVVHPNGQVTLHGSGTFTGTVAGKFGTGRLSYEGNIDSSVPTIPATGPGSAKWVLTGETGELASVVARGTFGGGPQDSWNEWYPVVCDGGFYGGGYSGQVISR